MEAELSGCGLMNHVYSGSGVQGEPDRRVIVYVNIDVRAWTCGYSKGRSLCVGIRVCNSGHSAIRGRFIRLD